MAFQNRIPDSPATPANVAAAALDAVYAEEMPLLWSHGYTILERIWGPNKGRSRNVVNVLDHGDHYKMPMNILRSQGGVVGADDAFTQSMLTFLGNAAWPFELYVSKIVLSKKELAQIGETDGKGRYNYVRAGFLAALETLKEQVAQDLYGFGYKQSGVISAAGTTTGRRTMQGFAFMCDGPTTPEQATGTGNGNKDGTLLRTGVARATLGGNDKYYGGIDRDDTTNGVTLTRGGWRGNHININGAGTRDHLYLAYNLATFGSATPTMWLSGVGVDRKFWALGNASAGPQQRFIGDSDWDLGGGALKFKGAPKLVEKTMDDTAFTDTAGEGGKYFETANISGGVVVADLEEEINKGCLAINEEKWEVVCLGKLTDGKGMPLKEPMQDSQALAAALITSLTWGGCSAGQPKYHAMLSEWTA